MFAGRGTWRNGARPVGWFPLYTPKCSNEVSSSEQTEKGQRLTLARHRSRTVPLLAATSNRPLLHVPKATMSSADILPPPSKTRYLTVPDTAAKKDSLKQK